LDIQLKAILTTPPSPICSKTRDVHRRARDTGLLGDISWLRPTFLEIDLRKRDGM